MLNLIAGRLPLPSLPQLGGACDAASGHDGGHHAGAAVKPSAADAGKSLKA